MFDVLLSNVIKPAATRIGTLATGLLIGIGANAQHADWVGTGIAGALLIGTDLMLAWFRKRSIVKTTVKEMAPAMPDPFQGGGR